MSHGLEALYDDDAPLNDPNYVPRVTPADGNVPSVVAKWGASTQIRWFHRFWREIKWGSYTQQEGYYLQSAMHKGPCCNSCLDDEEYGYTIDDACCCRALHDD